MSRVIFLLLALPGSLLAAAPPVPSPTAHGDRLRDAYFRLQANQLARDALSDIKSKQDWEKKAPEMRRQFLDMMGLWPLPARTDLKATIVGTIERPTYTVEKLHYQSLPGLYVSANLYLPKKRTGPCPAVLYVCGHGPTVIDKVPYGNKVTYQHHPAWLAEHGYVCLIVDTLQLGELPGLHHGTARLNMWWWISLGYTPAGIELWNALRGIDYLVSRKEVDPKRLGVTGRSGGGATSWWVGAADERVSCIIPVAGIADLLAHVSEGYPGRLATGVVSGHCDCMYMVNTYRWDYTQVIALCAPRALLLGNSDEDLIFPIPGYRRMTGKIEALYKMLGAADRFALLETRGPHKDTPELRRGAFRWLNRWLKNDNNAIVEPEHERIDPRQLKVFSRPPADAINDIAHERFRTPVRLEIPATPEVARAWWTGKRDELRQGLQDRVFRGWPQQPRPLDLRLAGEVTQEGVRVQAFDFQSEEAVSLRLWLVQSSNTRRPKEVLAGAVDEAGWLDWVADLGPAFRDLLHGGGNPAPRPYPAWNQPGFRQLRETLDRQGWAMAILAPRGVGPTRWSEQDPFDGKPAGHQIRRRFYLLGQTLEGQQVWDLRRAIQALHSTPALKDVPTTLQGKGEMGVLALYAMLFESSIRGIELWNPPSSHRKNPTFLNVLTVLDTPQAIALAWPRQVRLHVQPDERAAWEWSERLAKLLNEKGLQVRQLAE